jgi:ubiquinone/menaquinone biosynthesis C-methylase UbiE
VAILGITRRDLKVTANGLLPAGLRIRRSRRLWNGLNRESTYGYISHLRSGEWDPKDFATVGGRFVEQMMARYRDYGTVPQGSATVLEIGCGVGRFLKPLSENFKQVIGVDFSNAMLDSARDYCGDPANITLHQNDGSTLNGIPDGSVDFVVSAGVFQHITAQPAIMSYVHEGLRVLKPAGVLLFQFEGNRTNDVGFDQVGARITASALDDALTTAAAFRILEVSSDPRDPVRNVVIALGRTTERSGDSFASYPMSDREWLLGAYDGIGTDTEMQARMARESVPLTFYDD